MVWQMLGNEVCIFGHGTAGVSDWWFCDDACCGLYGSRSQE